MGNRPKIWDGPLTITQRGTNPGKNPGGITEVMFPNSHHPPAGGPERLGHKAIPRLIGGEFLSPERPIVGRHIEMLRAHMPETAIDKHDHALRPEGKIRPSDQGGMTTPTPDALCPKQPGEHKFRLLVPTPLDAAHDLRPPRQKRQALAN